MSAATEGAVVSITEQILPEPRERVKKLLKAAEQVHKQVLGITSGKYDTIAEIARLANSASWLSTDFDETLKKLMRGKKLLARAESADPYSPKTVQLRTEFLNRIQFIHNTFKSVVDTVPRLPAPRNEEGGYATLSDLYRDFIYLDSTDEFHSFEVRYTTDGHGAKQPDLLRGVAETRPMWLVATTKPVVLTDTGSRGVAPTNERFELGRFEIRIKLSGYRANSATDNDKIRSMTQIHPLEPFYSRDRSVPHPHVRSHQLCFGEGLTSCGRAMKACRIADVFLIINALLNEYNGNSPYVHLNQWVNIYRCRDCNDGFNDNHINDGTAGKCGNCSALMCGTCGKNCTMCTRKFICSQCGGKCAFCEKFGCRLCTYKCGKCTKKACSECDKKHPYPEIPKGFTVPKDLDCDLCPDCNELLVVKVKEYEQEQKKVSEKTAAPVSAGDKEEPKTGGDRKTAGDGAADKTAGGRGDTVGAARGRVAAAVSETSVEESTEAETVGERSSGTGSAGVRSIFGADQDVPAELLQ